MKRSIIILLFIGIIFIDRRYLLTRQDSLSNNNVTKNIEFFKKGYIYYVNKDEDTYIFTSEYQNIISQKIQELLKSEKYYM